MHHPSRQPPPLRKAPLQESIATALGHPADMRGFGVMSALLALAVAGFMVGGGVLMYRAAAQSSDVNSTLATAKIVTRGALTAFQTTGQLGALNTPAALAAHVFPRDALDSQGQPLDPWGGTWTLASPAVGTLPSGTAVVATVTQVPSSACVQMANQAAASNGFADVLVNGSSVLRQGQIDHAASGALCNAAPAVSVAFVATTAAQSTSGATMAAPCIMPAPKTNTGTGTCPSGDVTPSGATSFPQTSTTTYSCATLTSPLGSTTSPWSPSVSGYCAPACVAPASKTVTRSYNCPSGETVGGTSGGATSFTQSTTETYVCSGSTLTHSYGTWSPSASTECAVPTTCTAPPSKTVTRSYNCPSGETVGGITGGQTVFTQSRQIAVTCPAGPYGAPVTTATAWTPPVASECAIPQNGGGNHTCSVSCPVSCRVSVTGGNAGKNFTQYWAPGGAGCPADGTPTGQQATDIQGGPPFACTGTQTYTYTRTSSCPVPPGGNGGGSSGCTVAQVNAGTCATCSRTCGSTESGFATCQTHNIHATTCSYWGYSGSSCPTGATGGNWRAGLCP